MSERKGGTPFSGRERRGPPQQCPKERGNPAIVSDRKGITPRQFPKEKGEIPRYCPKEKGEHSVRYKREPRNIVQMKKRMTNVDTNTLLQEETNLNKKKLNRWNRHNINARFD